jgi:poly-gamma-glutamate synthesis protein (capsule biosynthesis protein)
MKPGVKQILLIVSLLLLSMAFLKCGNISQSSENDHLNENHSQNNEDEIIKIVALGDICFARHPMPGYNKKGVNVFKQVQGAFYNSEIVVGNLECVLCENTLLQADKSPDGGAYHLRQHPSIVWMLKDTGINIVNLANNHTMDYGVEGLEKTINTLDENNILYFGAGKNIEKASKPLIVEKQGVSFAFLGGNRIPPSSFYASQNKPGSNPIDKDTLTQQVENLEDKVDFTIVSLHWGLEGKTYTTNLQEKLAHKLIDSGADIILGHHPHVLQKTEWYNDKLIIYSMGNFLFNTSIPEWHYSTIYVIKVSRPKGIINCYPIPIFIDDEGKPNFTDNQKTVEFVMGFQDEK